jgi:hypothetical protein
MRKTVAFLLEQPIEVNIFQSLCDEIFHDHVLVMSSKYRGYLILEDKQINQLKTMQSHLLGYGIALTAVIGYNHNQMLEESLLIAQKFSRFTILHIADVMLMESYVGGRVLLDLFNQQIKQVSHETILTAKAFIENDCNANATAEALYIHRNTFSYRLSKFIDQTNLDIRDFHFARLFSLWLVLNNMMKN